MSDDHEVSLLGAGEIRDLAARHGIRPTKQWGQNFVVDGNTVRRIVRVAGVGPGDTVIEVGPGLGSLTLALLPEVDRVVAIEVDPVLAAALPETVAQHAPTLVDRLDVVQADALTVTERRWLNEYHAAVYETVAPHLTEDERVWLRDVTRAI